MANKDYEQKRNELWYEYTAMLRRNCASRYVFDKIFNRAYALGKEKETISQEEIEKAAEEYVLTRQQARHNAKKEEDATMRDFDKTIKAWDAYDMEQAFESGANLYICKQERDADTVIQGWAARHGNGPNVSGLRIYTVKPKRIVLLKMWDGHGEKSVLIDHRFFPDLTWDSDPLEVEIIIKRKKNG